MFKYQGNGLDKKCVNQSFQIRRKKSGTNSKSANRIIILQKIDYNPVIFGNFSKIDGTSAVFHYVFLKAFYAIHWQALQSEIMKKKSEVLPWIPCVLKHCWKKHGIQGKTSDHFSLKWNKNKNSLAFSDM